MTAGESTGGARLLLATVGALLLLAGGSLHTWLAFDGFGSPALVVAFFLNGIVSGVVAAWIVWTRGAVAGIAGLVVAAASLVGFVLSRTGTGVLGFRGTGLNPAPEAPLTLMTEVIAVLVLGALVFIDRHQLARKIDRVTPG